MHCLTTVTQAQIIPSGQIFKNKLAAKNTGYRNVRFRPFELNYALNLLCHHMGSTQSVGGHLIQIGHVPFAQLPDYAMLVLCPQLALPAQTD